MEAVKAHFIRCRLPNPERGQILLVIVLVMIVALTIGLSVVTRSITNLQISSEEESSQRALSAAEAGIEKALRSGNGSTAVDLKNNSKIEKITVNTISGEQLLVNNGNVVLKDDGADVWLAQNETTPKYQPTYNGTLSVNWGSSQDACANGSSNTAAALEVLVISEKSGGGKQIQTFPFDPCNNGSAFNRVGNNNFCTSTTPPSAKCPQMQIQNSSVQGKQFAYKATIPITNGILARMVPLYASTSIGVVGTPGLPAQGKVIESLGSSGSTQRKITVYKGYGKIPVEFFPYILFSP